MRCWWMVMISLFVGCSEPSTAPDAGTASTPSASATRKREGSWSVTLSRRTQDGAGPTRGVTLDEGTISTEGIDRPSEEALDELAEVVTKTDWQKMKIRLSLEGAVAGGTITTIIVERDGEPVTLETSDPSKYPPLATIAKALP